MVAEVLAPRSWRRRVWELQLLRSQGRRGCLDSQISGRMKQGTLTPGVGDGGEGGGGRAPSPRLLGKEEAGGLDSQVLGQRGLRALAGGGWEGGRCARGQPRGLWSLTPGSLEGGASPWGRGPGPAAGTLVLPWQGAGVMSVYLFTKRYAEEEMYRPHPAFYRPRLSDCSDYSGQFLQPEAWRRGRSPSDISSDVSIQMTQNYPPAIKYPDHLHISTSPC